ncbi:MAG: hypothetical protein IPG48_18805 [Saprospiraceae bacterium]|nr:hypothetical protein [Saprospiraceae bacterium]
MSIILTKKNIHRVRHYNLRLLDRDSTNPIKGHLFGLRISKEVQADKADVIYTLPISQISMECRG